MTTHTHTHTHTYEHAHTTQTHTQQFRKIPVEGSKVTASLWGPFDEFLITGHETGEVCRYDVIRVRLWLHPHTRSS